MASRWRRKQHWPWGNVAVTLSASQKLTVGGALSFSSGDAVTVGNAAQILVTGSLTSSDTTYSGGGGGANITVNSGGTLVANDETIFDLSDLTLNSGAIATLTSDVLYGVFTINSNTTLDVTGNDFSKLTTPDGLVAAGEEAQPSTLPETIGERPSQGSTRTSTTQMTNPLFPLLTFSPM